MADALDEDRVPDFLVADGRAVRDADRLADGGQGVEQAGGGMVVSFITGSSRVPVEGSEWVTSSVPGGLRPVTTR
ncbi:MAG: hypothetical protein ACRDP5_24735 [Streptosporangiaceae bacterium]